MLCTAVKLAGRNLYTIEHLLASLAGCGLSYIHIEVDGKEIPLLDGSAIQWVKAFEEVGIKSNSVKLIKEMREWVKYDIPEKSRRRHFLKKKIKGQKQKWFMYKLRENTCISFENDPDNEFDDYKWVSYWYPLYTIIFFKKEVYRKVLNSLSSSFCKEFNHD